MANFVSNDNATSLINAINSKKDTKPVEITYAEWIVLTDEERAGTHYLITDVPEQSGGGHVIENTSGTDMPQEDNLQFVGVYTEDDSTNNRTKVNIVRDMTKAQFNALSSSEKEGFIHITDEPDNPYNGDVSDAEIAFTEASNRANIESGEKVSNLFGKIKKWFSDLADMFVSKSGDTMTGDLSIAKDPFYGATLLKVGENYTGRVSIGSRSQSGAFSGTLATNWGWGSSEQKLTADRHYVFPDKDGTVALTDDISSRIGALTYSYFSMNSGSDNAYIKNFNLSAECIFIVFSIVPGFTQSALSIITWNTTTVTESQIGAYALSPTIVGSGDSRAIQLSGKKNWEFFYIVSNVKFTYGNSL